ncbi:MAG: hypothetical protein AAYR33_06670 [Acetobacteraceae bacterium]
MESDPHHWRDDAAPCDPKPQPQEVRQRRDNPAPERHFNFRRWVPFSLIGALVMIGFGAHHFRDNGQSPVPSQNLLPDTRENAAQSDPSIPTLPLSAIAERDAPAALKQISLSLSEKDRLRVALKRDDKRLVIMPLGILTGQPGAFLTISSAGFTQNILLGTEAQQIILPIDRYGEIKISILQDEGPTGLTLGVGTIYDVSPIAPLSTRGDTALLHVIVQ